MSVPAEIVRLPMTAAEARRAVQAINDRLNEARRLLLELYERRGWEVLGYASWRECVEAEFSQNQRYLYRQLEAAQVEIRIWPMGQIGSIPERQLRPLVPLRNEPDRLREAWSLANERTGGKPTGRDVQAAVDEVIARRGPLPGQMQFLDDVDDDEEPEQDAPRLATPAEIAAERWAKIFTEYADLANSVNRRGGMKSLISKWPIEKIRLSEMACQTVIESFTNYLDDIREALRCHDKV